MIECKHCKFFEVKRAEFTDELTEYGWCKIILPPFIHVPRSPKDFLIWIEDGECDLGIKKDEQP